MNLPSFAVVIVLSFLAVLAVLGLMTLRSVDGNSLETAEGIERKFNEWAVAQGMKT